MLEGTGDDCTPEVVAATHCGCVHRDRMEASNSAKSLIKAIDVSTVKPHCTFSEVAQADIDNVRAVDFRNAGGHGF